MVCEKGSVGACGDLSPMSQIALALMGEGEMFDNGKIVNSKEALKKIGLNNCRIEGQDSNDWKLVDTQDVIVHIFHPEKREFYDLEKMWSEEIPKEKAMI